MDRCESRDCKVGGNVAFILLVELLVLEAWKLPLAFERVLPRTGGDATPLLATTPWAICGGRWQNKVGDSDAGVQCGQAQDGAIWQDQQCCAQHLVPSRTRTRRDERYGTSRVTRDGKTGRIWQVGNPHAAKSWVRANEPRTGAPGAAIESHRRLFLLPARLLRVGKIRLRVGSYARRKLALA